MRRSPAWWADEPPRLSETGGDRRPGSAPAMEGPATLGRDELGGCEGEAGRLGSVRRSRGGHAFRQSHLECTTEYGPTGPIRALWLAEGPAVYSFLRPQLEDDLAGRDG